ncbi:glycine--tRNA ligase [Nakamurella sp. A5-74]|uniref:Multifunctional fusion protein n=1 Tax=Nakamurella sp. A5-74 TaxID=3158264 RepID=A0AAU8DTX4_9ACTN
MSSSTSSARPTADPAALTLQDVLLTLQRFWTERGAMVVQPFNTEVGAGTGNPATMLRVLGPEPWRVGYVEPSVRPDDARYGENPNRLQMHTQFQVILKPDPGNPQEIYLESLQAIGVDTDAHDIRFVEDNWAAPPLGSWGLGWEVWLDGLEITQFTYFQQAGGLTLDPVSVEITYGVERIVMALQGVSHFKDIAYAPGITYGEVYGQSEYEMSRYYLDDADIGVNQALFDQFAAEAEKMIELRLPVPAYVMVLKCSHAFNVLDARGAISTTERAKAFARMRTLTRGSAQLWAERRAELGHPLGVVEPLPAAELPASLPEFTEPATVLFEIGLEELPWTEVTRSRDLVLAAVTAKLGASRLDHGAITVEATPRRIVVLIEAVAPREPDAERTVKGPKLAAAYDADGAPTKAAQGFARGQKIDVAQLQTVLIDGAEHVGVVVTDTGRGAAELLAEIFGAVVTELRAEKNMRWRDPQLSYARPVRWLLALFGDQPIPVVASAISSGTTTRVHRGAPDPELPVTSADGYPAFLAGHGIVLADADRRAAVVAGATELAATVSGIVDADGEAVLLDQISALVEFPSPLLGSFEARYLDLPEAILTTVMRKHQRYLPVRSAADGALLPHFVAVANGTVDADLVRSGNEGVLRARYEDAAFFWRADQEISLVDHRAGLEKLTFADGLGSMADRARRIAVTASALGAVIGVDGDDHATLQRAGELAKFDLATHMVIELSSLAGTMAREYASLAGETPAVATALAEMEQPRSAGAALPSSTPGSLLALADRFDLLAGLFATGARATGSSDPFGLRRAALGVVAILRDQPALSAITLSVGLRTAADSLVTQGVQVQDGALSEAHEFIVKRYEQAVLDAAVAYPLVQAALPLADAPAVADAAVRDLQQLAGDAGFLALGAALQRSRRIVGPDTAPAYDPAVLVEDAERRLHEVLTGVREHWHGGSVAEFAAAAAPLAAPVDEFFQNVMVNADDPALRAARQGLLATLNDFADGVVDWAALLG